MRDDLDVLIHFNPALELHPKAKNIWYIQNAYPKETYAGGTIGVFNQYRPRLRRFSVHEREADAQVRPARSCRSRPSPSCSSRSPARNMPARCRSSAMTFAGRR